MFDFESIEITKLFNLPVWALNVLAIAVLSTLVLPRTISVIMFFALLPIGKMLSLWLIKRRRSCIKIGKQKQDLSFWYDCIQQNGSLARQFRIFFDISNLGDVPVRLSAVDIVKPKLYGEILHSECFPKTAIAPGITESGEVIILVQYKKQCRLARPSNTLMLSALDHFGYKHRWRTKIRDAQP